MNEPIERFCGIIDSLADGIRPSMIGWCCLAIDQHGIEEPHKNADILRKRLYSLVADGLDEKFLINGLLYYLTDMFDGFGDRDRTSERIDQHLAVIASLKEQLGLPQEGRLLKYSDDQIHGLIALSEGWLSGTPASRRQGEEMSAWLRQKWKDNFPPEFWEEYSQKQLHDMLPRMMEDG